MSTVCEVCGDIGFKHLLLCCKDCMCSAAHQYCLEEVIFDASLADWVCYECLQKRGEITCSRSLDIVSSEWPLNHAHFGSIVHQPVTKRVESARSVGLWRNRKSHVIKYNSPNKIVSSRTNSVRNKRFKRKSNMWPMDKCTKRRRRIATSTDCAKALQSCETIGAETAEGNNGENLEVENETAALNIKHPSPLIINCLGDIDQSYLLKGMEGLAHTSKKDPQSLTKPFKGLVMKTKNVVLGSKELESSSPIAEHRNSVLKKCGDTSKGMTNSGANLSSEYINNDNPTDQHTSDCWNDISSSSRHDNAESSESGERFVECQKGSFCQGGRTLKMATTSSSLEESGEDIPSENISSEWDDLQALPGCDYVLARTSDLSEAQKERVMAFIQETKPEITVFVSVIGKNNVQPPGPYLGISKEYAFAYFPHESTKVTLQRPGMSNKWHPLFYKRNENRKNMLMGRWLDFVRDNNVKEGDICLLEPMKGKRRFTFMVYLLHASAATLSTGGDGFQRVGPYPGVSIAMITSQVHNEEPTNEEHVSSERVVHEISPESLESEDSGDPFPPFYIVACRNDLSKSQKKIVEERVRAIRSEDPIYVAVMKNNNAGAAQRWMLELSVRYAAVYLPAGGRTVVLQRMEKTWNTQMVIHNGRRWFLNGGWTKFARDNGLRVGDICLFELRKKEKELTMNVHIISREQF